MNLTDVVENLVQSSFPNNSLENHCYRDTGNFTNLKKSQTQNQCGQIFRLVNSALAEELKTIHAFSQKTFTPEQWANENK